MKRPWVHSIIFPLFLILVLCHCSNDSGNINPELFTVPLVNFTCSSYTGTAPSSITFSDQSTNNPTNWIWDFGDGGRSTEQHPVHTYDTQGVYTVSLIASNSAGSDTLVKENYIRINATGNVAPLAFFSCNPTSGEHPLIVSFTDQSVNQPLTWHWEFGDGETSNQQNPVHTYNSAGSYTVSLKVSNTNGSSTKTKANLIDVTNELSTKYSLVFNHGGGDLCYYPRISPNGQYLAIEREEILSSTAYVAHIWLYNMYSRNIQQLTSNPPEGYYDDRNLRFTDDNTSVYFLRTHWHLDGTKEYMLCRIPVNGNEKDLEIWPTDGIHIYCFDVISNEAGKLVVAYYDAAQQQYYTGILDTETNTINTLQHLTGINHTTMVSLPDGSGFIGYSGSPETSIFSYKLNIHDFNANPSYEIEFQELRHIVWALSIDPDNQKLLVHQGVCTQSLTHAIPLSGGSATRYLTEYTLPRDAIWGADGYIYFTVNGNVMRYGPCE